jgi:hypothetical protein
MKMCFARHKTAVAIAAAMATGAAAPAFAVSHSDTGLGDVGLVPYYTVRDNLDTNISVVNTSDTYVAAFKIRMMEGDNSRDARDFNVFLSPNDVWVATLTMGEDGETPVIQVPAGETSCTAPWRNDAADCDPQVSFCPNAAGTAYYLELTNLAYDSRESVYGGSDGGPDSIERAQEGHIEIIEMGVADPAVSQLADWAEHENGVTAPGACTNISNVYERPSGAPGPQFITVTGSDLGCEENSIYAVGDSGTGVEAFLAEYCEPLNVLKVAANLIKVDQGVAGGMPITMLSNFYNPNGGVEDPAAPAADDINDLPFLPTPNLQNATPAVSTQVADGAPIVEAFTLGEDAVSSLISATAVINEYAVGGAATAQQAWVVTFPTKHLYVDPFYGKATPAPFANFFTAPGVSCDRVEFQYYNREELDVTDPIGGIVPSPLPIEPIPQDSICEEAMTLNFGSVPLLGSGNNYAVERDPGFDAGWMRLIFPDAGTITGLGGTEFVGLPTIGFAVKSLENGVANAGFILNYGIVSEHAYQREIITPTP